MNHIASPDLVSHLYGEGSPRHRARLERHLAACPLCASAAAELSADLASFTDTLSTAPDADARAGERIWQSIRPQISAAPPQ